MKPAVAALTLSAALVSASALADDTAFRVRFGEYDNYQRVGASVRFAPLWSSGWGGWRATLHPEAEVSRFRYTGHAPGADTLYQGGVIGMFRIVRGEGALRPYAEFGLGGALFSRDKLGSRNFSTRFQFSEHIGLGLEWANGVSAGWQYSHYSNADIKLPNDGIDLHQIVIGAHF